jgi:hypothetical protein
MIQTRRSRVEGEGAVTTIQVTAADGEVVDIQRWSTTQVETSGGGGHIHNGDGYIRDVTTTSTSIGHCKAFIKSSDGSEIALDVGDSLSLRQGSRVRLVRTQPTGGRPLIVSLLNLDTHNYTDFDILFALRDAVPMKTSGQFLMKGEGAILPYWPYVGLWFLAILLAPFTLFLSLLAIITYAFWRGGEVKRRMKALDQLLVTRLARLKGAVDSVRASGAPTSVTVGD